VKILFKNSVFTIASLPLTCNLIFQKITMKIIITLLLNISIIQGWSQDFSCLNVNFRCLDSSVPNDMKYHSYGDWCEGVYCKLVSGGISVHKVMLDETQLDCEQDQWLLQASTISNDTVNISAHFRLIDYEYRMDTQLHENEVFAWDIKETLSKYKIPGHYMDIVAWKEHNEIDTLIQSIPGYTNYSIEDKVYYPLSLTYGHSKGGNVDSATVVLRTVHEIKTFNYKVVTSSGLKEQGDGHRVSPKRTFKINVPIIDEKWVCLFINIDFQKSGQTRKAVLIKI